MTLREAWRSARYAFRSSRAAGGSPQWRPAAWRRFWHSYRRYGQLANWDWRTAERSLYPCLGDDVGATPIEPIYFYQDAWAFERIVAARPRLHVDVGSHHKYVALLSKVVETVMVDIRPLALPLPSIGFKQGSILALPFADGSLESVSSLCVVEHIGLGRYGDELDPRGSERAIAELNRVVRPGGNLYLSVPIDDENLVFFNAHRAFRPAYLRELWAPFEVVQSRFIYGNEFTEAERPGAGVGCYHLRRPAAAGSTS